MSTAGEKPGGDIGWRTWLRRGFERAVHSKLLLLLFIAQLTLVPIIQGIWGRRQFEQIAAGRVRGWLEQATRAAGSGADWDIERLRNSDLNVPGLALVTDEGLIIEIDSFVRGLLGPVEDPPDTGSVSRLLCLLLASPAFGASTERGSSKG
jgi:hypothetical protein